VPIYEYVCSNCGRRLEVMHSIHGHGPSACPECGGSMKKAFSPPAVHFKGTGWARKESAAKVRPSKAKEGGDAPDSTGSAKPAATETPSAKPDSPA
jgi:putative FmdB family regulatory protein